MVLRQNVRPVSTRLAAVFVAATLGLVALVLAGCGALPVSYGPAGSGKTVVSSNGFMGPDAQERNHYLRLAMEDTTHGH